MEIERSRKRDGNSVVFVLKLRHWEIYCRPVDREFVIARTWSNFRTLHKLAQGWAVICAGCLSRFRCDQIRG